MTWAKRVRVGGPSHRAVLFVLADYADEKGSCYPGQDTIAEQAGMSTRTVVRVMGELEAAGVLSRKRRYHGLIRTSDRVHLNLSDQEAPYLTDCHPRLDAIPSPKRGRHRVRQAKATSTTPVGDNVSPVEEPQEEPQGSSDAKASSKPKATDDPKVRQAHELATIAFSQKVKPSLAVNGKGSAFAAVLKLFQAKLEAGFEYPILKRVAESEDVVWTSSGVQYAYLQAKRAQPAKRVRLNVDGQRIV